MHFSLGRWGASLALIVIGGLAVPTTAHAYCRTTTQPIPANYNPSRGCYTQGVYLFWRNACVSFALNQNASRSIPFDDAKRIIDSSFATWAAVKCPDTNESLGIAAADLGAVACGEVRYNADSANQNVIVFRDDGWPYNDPYSTLGLTTVTFNADTGEIYDADMELNSSGRNLSITDQVPTNGFDLASVVTHEAGHFFGLAHATDSKSTMYASYKPGTTQLRTLAQDDIKGICAIYPSTTERNVSLSVSENGTVLADACDPTPRHGFTSQCTKSATKDKCSASSGTLSSWGMSATVTVVAAGLLFARRRRCV